MIEIVRGGLVESRHPLHIAVSDASGALVASVGNPAEETFYRSAAKPMQALPLVEEGVVERFGFTEAELALCCASHEGEAEHVAGARSILAKAGVPEDALRCGPHLPFSSRSAHELVREGHPSRPIHNNCSGKHAGMLALAKAMDWPLEGYHLAEHPVQKRMLREVARWSGVEETAIGIAVDGCGVVCFSVPLQDMATSFARFAAAAEDGGAPARIVDAMTSHPFYVGGTRRACTEVMERSGRRAFVKLGAEGVYGGGLPGRGLGFAIKVPDGARRAVEVAMVRVVGALGGLEREDVEALDHWWSPPVKNTRNEVVGEIRAAFELEWH